MWGIKGERINGRDLTPAEVVGKMKRSVYLKYFAYWKAFQKREFGIDLDKPDEEEDETPRFWVERDGDTPFNRWGDEVASRPRG
ncbi:MAG TPA: hypothetical protein VN756_08905 [Solirubrobacterales bacterium]|nr:hypothetical protein [Solirubrobacterales bacterium]